MNEITIENESKTDPNSNPINMRQMFNVACRWLAGGVHALLFRDYRWPWRSTVVYCEFLLRASTRWCSLGVHLFVWTEVLSVENQTSPHIIRIDSKEQFLGIDRSRRRIDVFCNRLNIRQPTQAFERPPEHDRTAGFEIAKLYRQKNSAFKHRRRISSRQQWFFRWDGRAV